MSKFVLSVTEGNWKNSTPTMKLHKHIKELN